MPYIVELILNNVINGFSLDGTGRHSFFSVNDKKLFFDLHENLNMKAFLINSNHSV